MLKSSSISDHWKERVLPAYAGRIAIASCRGFILLLLGLTPIFLVALVWPGGSEAYAKAMLSVPVIVGLSALCIPWMWWRNRARPSAEATQAYGPGDKMLHKLTLGVPVLPEVLHDIEKALFLRSAPHPEPARHLFVTGLARAGSTVLTREIYASGAFGSLTYDDMPMVLAPNIWARFSGSRSIARHERAHGDGIEVDGKSPEALEEAFWRVQDGASYIHPDRIGAHVPDVELLGDYADFIRLVLLKTGKQRYLAKNNNNILRLRPLAEAFPNSLFLVPFREPLDHAASLMRQHARFSNVDAFTTAYMGWLGHHEFGADHRPFELDALPRGDPGQVDYWLDIWCKVYTHLAAIRLPNIRLVSLEALASDPTCWEGLAADIGIPVGPPTEITARQPRDLPECDAALLSKARALYDEMSARR